MFETGLRIIDRLSVLLAVIAGIALTFLAVFTIVDIVMRYVVNDPIVGSIDVIKLALLVMTVCALPYAGRTDCHIVVDIVPNFSNPRLTAARDAAGKVLLAILFAIMAWQGWLRSEEAILMGEASNLLEIPFTWFYRVLALCAAFYAFILIYEAALLLAVGDVRKLEEGLDDYEVGA